MDKQYIDTLNKPLIDQHYNLSDFDNLASMVDTAYQIFAPYPVIKSTGVCYCDGCFHEPLITYWSEYSGTNMIPDELLERYFSSEVTDYTIVQKQMYDLLPRLMNDFIQGKAFGILGRWDAFKWCQFSETKGIGWRLEEKQFMQAFALAYFDIYINHPDGWQRFDEFNGAMEIVTMFYRSGLDIQPLLSLWLSSIDGFLACLYLGLVVRMDIEEGKFCDTFTEEYPDYNNMVDTWLNDHAKEFADAFNNATRDSDFKKSDRIDKLYIMEGLTYFRNLSTTIQEI